MSKPAADRLAAIGHPRRRARTAFFVFVLVMAVFAAQLLRLQGFNADEMSKEALAMRLTRAEVPAARGEIADANGTVLARSVERRDITGDPVAAESYKGELDGRTVTGIDGLCAVLGSILGGDPAEISKKFAEASKRKSRFVYLSKDATPAQWSQIKSLGLPGVFSEQRQRREYPQGTALSPLLGWVNNAGIPGGGIEQMLDEQLGGKDGIHQVERARNGAEIATGDNLDQKPIPGRNVELTIDNDIQWYAQNQLAAQVRSVKALSGEVVVSDKAGNILAAASYPSFDNNNMATAKAGTLQNKAFNDTFEPGSTQKVVTVGSVVEEGLLTPTSQVVVPPTLKRAGRPFRDSHPHGTEHLTLAGVIAQSSNMGTILAGERLPKEKLFSYMQKFGLGKTTGIGFPGESAGIVPKVTTWKGDTWYTIMFGQGLASSSMQQIGIFQTIANGGVRNPLKLVKGVQNGDGTMEAPKDDRTATRVFSADTSTKMLGMLQGVVTKEGSAPKAAVPGYDVAGKTSTAERYSVEKKRYDGVTAGFIGLAPVKKPELIVSVNIQKPQSGTFGGDVAAPVFSKVMAFALTHRRIPPSKSTKLPYPIEYSTKESTNK